MRSPESRPKSRVGIVLAFVAAAVLPAGWHVWSAIHGESAAPTTKHTSARRTIADGWRWHAPAAQSAAKLAAAVRATGRIDPDGVAQALGKVELDENGDVVVGPKARTALEESFKTVPLDLTPEELQALQDMIRAGLSGPAGEQTASIVGNYYRYRKALQTLEAKPTAPAGSDTDRARVERLAALRREHLGPVVSTKFYAQDEALQRFLLERQQAESVSGSGQAANAVQLQRDLENGLFFLPSRNSPAAIELKRQLETLRAQQASDEHIRYVQTQQLGLHTASELARTDAERQDWQRRYAQFRQQRQYVLSAGLSEEDKRAQIDALLKQHFKAEELEAIGAYNVE